jgi:small subunit ribosomal protein S17
MADQAEDQTPPEDAQDAGAEPRQDDAPAEGSDELTEAADAAEATAADGEADADSARDGDTGDGAPSAAAAEGGSTAERLSPKERRRLARSTHVGPAKPARSPEERHAARVADRRAKAVRRRVRRQQERAKASERRASAPPPQPLAPVHAPVEGKRKVRQGIVISDKAEKTIVVRIDVARPHRRYEKIVRSSSTLRAHDEANEANEGDVVRVIESRPLSRTKRWRLVEVLERAR